MASQQIRTTIHGRPIGRPFAKRTACGLFTKRQRDQIPVTSVITEATCHECLAELSHAAQ